MRKLASLTLAITLLLSTLPVSARAAAAFLPNQDPARYLNSDGSLNVPSNFDGSFDLSGWDVRLDTQGLTFRPASATLGQWSSLGGAGTGLSGPYVNDLIFRGGILYAGGNFTDAGGDPDADHIAKYSSGAWSSLGGAGTGLNGTYVYDIEFQGSVLYATGSFTDAGTDVNADGIAKYSGGVWSSLGGAGTGFNSNGLRMLFSGGVLYATGNFTDAGSDLNADRIAKYSSGAWSSLGGANTGLNSQAFDLVMSGGVLYAAGTFTDAGTDLNADRIAKFSSGAWSSLGGAGTGLNSDVNDIEFNGGVLYAAGNFTDAGSDLDADYIAKYSGGAWSSLGGAGTGLSSAVYQIRFRDGVLYAGGAFTDAGADSDADYIAKYSGGVWSSLDGAGTGLNSGVNDIEFDGDALVAGGEFTDAGADSDADYVAQFGVPPVSSSGGSTPSNNPSSKEIKPTGTTTFSFGRAYASVPATAIPPGETNCKIVITESGTSAKYGFALDDTVYDVKIVCDGGSLSLLYMPISVCIRPKDGVTNNKTLFHRHAGADFAALSGGSGPAGYVCGSTSALSLFTLGQFALPSTGYAPGIVTNLNAQPAAPYLKYDSMVLEIPQLSLSANIWGVPQTPNGWDVSWLGANAGYLVGTAFPTWVGNSVITAHVWNADNTAGPFFHLRSLQYGNQFYIHTGGQTYVYEVRSSRQVSENNLGVMSDSKYSLITLITCEAYNESDGDYLYRRAVQAVLIEVK